MKLALFDLDNTLLHGDSDYEWAQYLIEQGVLERDYYEARNNEFYDQYKAGTLDILAFLDFQLAPLARYPRAQLDEWHRGFMRTRILPMIKPKGRTLVANHLQAGDLCAIITATNAFVTAPIAAELRIDHLLATRIEEVNGAFTGKPQGTPTFREGKIERLDEWLASRGARLADFETSWFYSDSLNDIPLLERVNRPVAVDPDPQLEALARSRGWPVMSLL
jgi:HAD superfamily hydrolase (TIGR01490 family)